MASNLEYLDPRWQKLRLRTFERDGWACKACRSTTTTLVAHHKRYNGGRIWSSPLTAIQTLCTDCHEALGPHPKGGVWWEDDEEGLPCFTHEHCPRCGSTGVGWGPKYGWPQKCKCGRVLSWRRPPHLFVGLAADTAALLSRMKGIRFAGTGERVRIHDDRLAGAIKPESAGLVFWCPCCQASGRNGLPI